MLRVTSLTKKYANGTVALDHVSFSAKAGILGLLGPNGAGKSTFLRTIATLQEPDSGEIFFEDINILQAPVALRQQLGYLPQSFGVYPGMSAEDLLDYLAVLKGIKSGAERKKRIGEVLSLTHLDSARKKRVDRFSGGMKQRFGIAQVLLNRPRLVVVDEPTAGLDPAERNHFLNLLRELATDRLVIFSTHLVEDLMNLCGQVVVLQAGRVQLDDPPSRAIAALEGKVWAGAEPENSLLLPPHVTLLSAAYHPESRRTLRVFSLENPGSSFISVPATLEDAYFLALSPSRLPISSCTEDGF